MDLFTYLVAIKINPIPYPLTKGNVFQEGAAPSSLVANLSGPGGAVEGKGVLNQL